MSQSYPFIKEEKMQLPAIDPISNFMLLQVREVTWNNFDTCCPQNAQTRGNRKGKGGE